MKNVVAGLLVLFCHVSAAAELRCAWLIRAAAKVPVTSGTPMSIPSFPGAQKLLGLLMTTPAIAAGVIKSGFDDEKKEIPLPNFFLADASQPSFEEAPEFEWVANRTAALAFRFDRASREIQDHLDTEVLPVPPRLFSGEEAGVALEGLFRAAASEGAGWKSFVDNVLATDRVDVAPLRRAAAQAKEGKLPKSSFFWCFAKDPDSGTEIDIVLYMNDDVPWLTVIVSNPRKYRVD